MRMRVALDTNALYTVPAGCARHIRGLMRGMRELNDPGIEVVPFAWEVYNLDYKQPARALKTFYRELIWAPLHAPRQLRSGRFDLLHSAAGCFIPAPRGLPEVVTLHDLALIRHPERFRPWHRWSGQQRLKRIHSARRILCVSRFSANEAVELLGIQPDRIEITYNGCDFLGEPPAEEPVPQSSLPDDFFLFVGTLEPGKNLALLKDIYAGARESRIALPPLLIAGARWSGVGTEGAPPPDWHYLGRIPDSQLVYLFRRARALLFPSKYEGYGLPVVEAMSLGCPVVCGRVASLPEVAGDAAAYANLEVEPFLQAMRRLIDEPAWREERRRMGLERAQQFTWKRCAEGTVEAYRMTLGSTTKP